MTKEYKERSCLLGTCKDLATQPSILEVLDDELRRSGFAGTTDVPKLILLCLYTRWFEKPVSLVIKGPSGCGKSFALQAGLKFVPSAAFDEFSGMSEKALLYLDGLDLKHRFLVIGEAAGLSQGVGRAFLRQLLTEDKVRYATVQSTSNGLKGQELKPLEGPTGLIMTTTANALHPEDESRMLSYHLDESIERVREALVRQATGTKAVEYQGTDLVPWHALHDFVESGNRTVEIPFAEELAHKLPLSHFRVMRDFPKVLALIKAHALMHQLSRERGETGGVIAMLEDYRAVYHLIQEPLAQGLETSVPEMIRTVVKKVEELQKDNPVEVPYATQAGISQVKLAEALGRDQSVISRHVRKAVGQGFLKDLAPGQGREGKLIIGDRKLPSGTVLPDPEELEFNTVKEEILESV